MYHDLVSKDGIHSNISILDYVIRIDRNSPEWLVITIATCHNPLDITTLWMVIII